MSQREEQEQGSDQKAIGKQRLKAREGNRNAEPCNEFHAPNSVGRAMETWAHEHASLGGDMETWDCRISREKVVIDMSIRGAVALAKA